MLIKALVEFDDLYEGNVRYLTGRDLETGGVVKLAGEFPDVELGIPYELEGEFIGRVFDGMNFSLKATKEVKLKPDLERLEAKVAKVKELTSKKK